MDLNTGSPGSPAHSDQHAAPLTADEARVKEFLEQLAFVGEIELPSSPDSPLAERQRGLPAIPLPPPAHLTRQHTAGLGINTNLERGTEVAAALRQERVAGGWLTREEHAEQQKAATEQEERNTKLHIHWAELRAMHRRQYLGTAMLRPALRAVRRNNMLTVLLQEVNETTVLAHCAEHIRGSDGGGGGISNTGDAHMRNSDGGIAAPHRDGGIEQQPQQQPQAGHSHVLAPQLAKAQERTVTVFSQEARHKITFDTYSCSACARGKEVWPTPLLHGFWQSTPVNPTVWFDVELLELYTQLAFRQGVGATGDSVV
jgi:hypothetical protein